MEIDCSLFGVPPYTLGLLGFVHTVNKSDICSRDNTARTLCVPWVCCSPQPVLLLPCPAHVSCPYYHPSESSLPPPSPPADRFSHPSCSCHSWCQDHTSYNSYDSLIECRSVSRWKWTRLCWKITIHFLVLIIFFISLRTFHNQCQKLFNPLLKLKQVGSFQWYIRQLMWSMHTTSPETTVIFTLNWM